MSLSTSSSKSGMKRNIYYILLSFLLGWLISYAFLWKLNSGKNGFWEGFLPIQERSLSEGTKNIILGNSTSSVGLRAKFFTEKTENFSMGAGHVVIAHGILNKVLSKSNDLDTVVLCFDNLMFFVDSVKRRKGDFRQFVKNGIPWYDIPNASFGEKLNFMISYNWPLFSYSLKGENLSIKTLLKKIRNKNVVKKSPFNYAVEEGDKKVKGYEKVHKKLKGVKQNLLALESLIKLISENKLKLQLIRMPYSESFISGRSEWWNGQFDYFLSMVGTYSEKYNVEYNFKDLGDYNLGNHLFKDPNHLNDEGAHFISKQLDSLL